MKKFKRIYIAVPTAFLLAGGCAALFYKRTSVTRPENCYNQYIPANPSDHDADGDGIDDRTDLLIGALNYVKTRPKYGSRYYTGGYPDDGYGVCCDVVAFALRDAGYDLKELVAEDIAENPNDYKVDIPDPNIDFRRVRNLNVFFGHKALSLTTDIYEIEQWQGGDIVVFNRHIGIISDRRNKNGVPYLIHHSSKWQLAYEQDFLEKRKDNIVAHYRLL